MERRDNYTIQANQAKERFLTYDQPALIRKFGLRFDKTYLYVNLLCKLYRIHRDTGDLQRLDGDVWADGNSYNEVMTLLDLLCDSRDDRQVAGRWKNMQSFGLLFHRNLLEDAKDPWAIRFDKDPEGFHKSCRALGGKPVSGADISYAIEVFDGLPICIQFWHGDDEFFPRLRYLWDENADQYLRYETMYFAVSLLLRRIGENMGI